LVARDAGGRGVGTVRLWNIEAGAVNALPLGPLAVDSALKSAGIGPALTKHAVAEAARRRHGALLLVRAAPYYDPFGLSTDRTDRLAMPGPYEKHRLLALELKAGALDGAKGVLKAAGRKVEPASEAALRAA